MNWNVYSKVDGTLPMEGLPTHKREEFGPLIDLHCYLRISVPGKVQLKINDSAGLELAYDFWERVVSDARISDEFKQLHVSSIKLNPDLDERSEARNF